jgi:hypothetical protein
LMSLLIFTHKMELPESGLGSSSSKKNKILNFSSKNQT